MYRVPNEMSHLQFLESLSTHLMTVKKRKPQQSRNIYTLAAASGKKISNDMTLPSFDSRMSHQRRADILDVWANPISKNTLATKFPLRLDGNIIHLWHTNLGCYVNVECVMEEIWTIEWLEHKKINLNNNWGGKYPTRAGKKAQ